MNLAIILYGITRDQANLTSTAFFDQVLNVLNKEFSVTVYLNAFLLDECPVSRVKPQTFKVKNPNDWTLFNPDHHSTFNQLDFMNNFDYSSYLSIAHDPFRNNKLSCKHYINALYSLQESFSQSSSRQYDCYFISRLDLLYKSNEDLLSSCLDVANNPTQNTLYTPAWEKNRGLNDRIAIGNFHVSNLYCHRFRDYLLYKKTSSYYNIHSESMLKRFSEYNNLSNKHFKFIASRIRINGLIEKERYTA